MIRVHISGDFMIGGISVGIMETGGNGPRVICRVNDQGVIMPNEVLAPGTGPAVPTFALPDDMARALLEELTRWYHAAEDTRALRKDYDDERRRVDRLTEAVIGIAWRSQPETS